MKSENIGITVTSAVSPEKKPLEKNWVNILFLTLTPVVGIGGTAWLIYNDGIYAKTLILALIWAILGGMSITAGYHRLLAHKSYETVWPIKLLLLIFGATTFENSALKWCADHRDHHRFVDTDQDPYNINKGFWFAHIGWIFLKNPNRNFNNSPDLVKDRWVQFQHNWYLPLAIGVGLVMPMAIGSFWGDPWGALIIAGFLRLVVNHHFTFFINSLCHFVGGQPYSDKTTARDSWYMAFFTYGEGYHNFHHAFQADYRNGIRAWHFDPGKWMIKSLEFLGMAKGLRYTPQSRILKAKLQMEEIRIKRKIDHSAHPFLNDLIVSSRLKVEEAQDRIYALTEEYRRLKKEKIALFSDRVQQLKDEIEKAKLHFQTAAKEWAELRRKEVLMTLMEKA